MGFVCDWCMSHTTGGTPFLSSPTRTLSLHAARATPSRRRCRNAPGTLHISKSKVRRVHDLWLFRRARRLLCMECRSVARLLAHGDGFGSDKRCMPARMLGLLVLMKSYHFKTKPHTFSISRAPTGRALCRGCKRIVAKGEIRLVTHAFVRPGRERAHFVRHIGCVTTQLLNAVLAAHGSVSGVPVAANMVMDTPSLSTAHAQLCQLATQSS